MYSYFSKTPNVFNLYSLPDVKKFSSKNFSDSSSASEMKLTWKFLLWKFPTQKFSELWYIIATTFVVHVWKDHVCTVYIFKPGLVKCKSHAQTYSKTSHQLTVILCVHGNILFVATLLICTRCISQAYANWCLRWWSLSSVSCNS